MRRWTGRADLVDALEQPKIVSGMSTRSGYEEWEDRMRMTRLASLVVICLGVVFMAAISARAAEAPRMSTEQLKSMIEDPNVIVIDVRQDNDWAESNAKIKGAVRENPAQPTAWMNKYPKEKTLVFYCS